MNTSSNFPQAIEVDEDAHEQHTEPPASSSSATLSSSSSSGVSSSSSSALASDSLRRARLPSDDSLQRSPTRQRIDADASGVNNSSLPAPSAQNLTRQTSSSSNASSSSINSALDESDFECGLCLSLLVDPISIACGHTFCQPCLVKALGVSKKECPTCRSPCHLEAEQLPVNITLSNVIQKHFPEQYAGRKAWAMEEKKEWTTRLAIFFMGGVTFPYSSIGLRLFEPRYLLMARRAMAGDKRFGFMPGVMPKPGSFGVVLYIETCEYAADGAALIECAIQERFRLINSWEEHGTFGLVRAQVEYVKDSPMPPISSSPSSASSSSSSSSSVSSSSSSSSSSAAASDPKSPSVKELVTEVKAFLTRTAGARFDRKFGKFPEFSEGNPQSGEKISFYLASVLSRILSPAVKREIMESRSTVHRLQLCLSIARKMEADSK